MKKLINLIAIIIGSLIPSYLFATAQIPERIVIDGQEYALCSCPLAKSKDTLEAALYHKHKTPVGYSTALWRGYIGYWCLHNDKLYLDSIMLGYKGPIIKVQDDDIFANYLDNGKVWANWMNEEIRVVSGKLIEYVHMGWESTYEHEDYYTFKDGKIVSRRTVENKTVQTSSLAHNDKEAVSEFNEFTENLFAKLPTLEGIFIVRITYTEFEKDGTPTKTNVEIVRHGKDQNKDYEALDSLVEAISEYSLKHIMSDVYIIDGEIVSRPMAYPISRKEIKSEKTTEETIKIKSEKKLKKHSRKNKMNFFVLPH